MFFGNVIRERSETCSHGNSENVRWERLEKFLGECFETCLKEHSKNVRWEQLRNVKIEKVLWDCSKKAMYE